MGKARLDRDFREFLESLNSAGVRYLVLGGYAVNCHGYHRATGDLDVWIAMDLANASKISKVMQRFGGFPASQVPPELFLKKGKIIQFGRVPVRIDLLTKPSGVSFEECHAHRLEVELDGVVIPLISLPDLIRNKQASGRPKDIADVEKLSGMERRGKNRQRR